MAVPFSLASLTAELEPGTVALVGAGPGDPGLLTVHALNLLAQAEVIFYDNLVSAEVLALASPQAERVFVGKERGRHHVSQEETIARMIAAARAQRRVVRLKGGDPFVFGRGGEEVDALRAEGISVRVVPGITAAVGAAAYAQIPLTHRDHAHGCLFATGHRQVAKSDEYDWPALVSPHLTVAFYMGRHRLAEIARQLIAHGRDPETPAALVERATTPQQKVLRGRLGTLPVLAEAFGVGAPSILFVGGVAQERTGALPAAPGWEGSLQMASVTPDKA